MTNKKRKGFTIVELVIVIAVIAILAGVLIPTFASIIDKANQSSDIQAVRQMNVLLKAESVDKTLSIGDVINIVSEAGYDTEEKLTPKSKSNYFYWHNGTNTIFLAKVEESKELIYPKDNDVLTTNFNTLELTKENGFHELVQSYKDNPPSAGDNGIVIPEGVIAAIVSDSEGLQEVLANLETYGVNYIVLESNNDGYVINQATFIKSDLTIDLNGNTLTLVDSNDDEKIEKTLEESGLDPEDEEYYKILSEIVNPVITVLGTLNVVDNSGGSGKIVINEEVSSYSWMFSSGIRVDVGTLNLDNVTVTADRSWNIDNYGILSVTNSNFTVSEGNGIYNAGTATVNNTNLLSCQYAKSILSFIGLNSHISLLICFIYGSPIDKPCVFNILIYEIILLNFILLSFFFLFCSLLI